MIFRFTKNIRIFLIVAISLTILSSGAIGTLEYLFRNKQFTPILANQSVWQHRVNNQASLEKAVALKRKGIEMDVTFQDDQIYVTHDLPTEKTLLFTDFIKEVPSEMEVWIDFKKLKVADIPKILNIIERIDPKLNLKKRAFIESRNAKALKYLSTKGYQTLFWIYPYPNTRAHFFYNLQNKYLIATSSFTGVSMDHEHLDQRSAQTFKNIPLLVFTINQEKKMKSVLSLPNVKVVLTDQNI